MGPPGDCWKIKHHQNSVEFSKSTILELFFCGNLQLPGCWICFVKAKTTFGSIPRQGSGIPRGNSRNTSQSWRGYLSEGLDGAISEWQCFRKDATLMICDRFFLFSKWSSYMHFVAELDVWNKNGRDLCMYVPPWTVLQLQNQCQWNWMIRQAISFRGNVGKGWTTSNTRRVYE